MATERTRPRFTCSTGFSFAQVAALEGRILDELFAGAGQAKAAG